MFTPKAPSQTRSEVSRLNAFASTDQNLWEQYSKEVEEKILAMIDDNCSFEEIHRFASSFRSRIAKELKQEREKDHAFGQYRNSERELSIRHDIYSNKHFATSAGANYPILIKLKAIILSQESTKQVTKQTDKPSLIEYQSRPQGSTYLPDRIEMTYGMDYANLSFSMRLTPNNAFPSYLEPHISVTHGHMNHYVLTTAMAGLNDFFIDLKKTDDEQTYLNKVGLLAYDLSRLMFLERGGAAVHGWIIRGLLKSKFKIDIGNLSIFGIPFDIYAQVQMDRDQYARDFMRSISRSMMHVSEEKKAKSSKQEQEEQVKSTYPDFIELTSSDSKQEKTDLRSLKDVFSTAINLPTPKDQSDQNSPYSGFFSTNNNLAEGYSFVNSTQCLLRGDTRKPEFIMACGGFNPWASHDLFQLLEQMDSCEDTQEFNRLNQLLKNMLSSNQIIPEEVEVTQQIIALQGMLEETQDDNLKSICKTEIKTLEERLQFISQPEYKIKQLKDKLQKEELKALTGAVFNPLDPNLHRATTQANASGFVSFTDSLAVASTFSTKFSRLAEPVSVGYVYVVRGWGTLIANKSAQHGFEHEYSLPGGLDWRDVLAFREVKYDSKARCFHFSGSTFINKEFSAKFKSQAKEIMGLLSNRTPGKEEQNSKGNDNPSPSCTIL